MARLTKGATRTTEQIVLFGEVLFDHFPDGSEELGGAPFNVAWHLQGMGVSPLLISRVGEDDRGARVRTAMTEWGLDTSALQRDSHRPTGTVEVQLVDGEPTFEIISQRAYDYIEWEDRLTGLRPSWLYLGSLALREQTSRRTAQRLLQSKETRVFLDVNLRSPWWEPNLVQELLDRSQEIKLNDAELTQLVPEESGLDSSSRAVLSRFGPERLYITRGAQGAVAFTTDGHRESVRPARGAEVVDAVGAGDAFAAVLLLARLESWPLATALRRAQAFAAAIVGVRGATLADRSVYEEFRRAWSLS